MTTTSSVQHAPEYALHREAVTTVDGLPATLTDKKQGMNCHGYLSALVQVIPTGGANPSVELLTWSDAAGHFIVQNAPVTKAGPAANTPFEFAVDCRSRIIYLRVTALAAGQCDILVAGHELDHAR